ncbi:MAG: RNA polymerase sigma factor [Candidatus Staskawiczbacteria bacterium]|nr:RNA polymerase sigma factor [Candidatus Staskawiczbacteria bacterium]
MDSLNEQFAQIYDQYIEKIYRFVYLKVNSQEIAEDITSKVFIRGWEAYQKQGLEIKNLGAFLYQIARNAVIDYYREKGRSNIISVDASPQIADPGTNAQDKAILSADVEVVKKAIYKLKQQEHQDVIIWHYLEDIPIADIAEMLNKPAGTVRVMLL